MIVPCDTCEEANKKLRSLIALLNADVHLNYIYTENDNKDPTKRRLFPGQLSIHCKLCGDTGWRLTQKGEAFAALLGIKFKPGEEIPF